MLKRFYETSNNKQAQLTILIVIIASTLGFGLIDLFNDFNLFFPIFVRDVVLMSAIGYAVYKNKLFVAVVMALLLIYLTLPVTLINHLMWSPTTMTVSRLLNLIIGSIIAIYLFLMVLSTIIYDRLVFNFTKKIDKHLLILLIITGIYVYFFEGITLFILLSIPIVLAITLRSQITATILLIYALVHTLFILLMAVVGETIGEWSAQMYFINILGVILLVINTVYLIIALRKNIDNNEFQMNYYTN